MPKVLISDKMSPRAEQIFRDRGIDVDVKVGLDADQLKSIIGNYDGLAVRSATKITPDILGSANTNLKVIGRAGIGVDNIDLDAATQAGVVVMNTPYGNAVTTAEHTIAMLMALSRQIPQANASTHAGKWEKSKFMGAEIYNKVLGVIGCGNIGRIVVDRAQGLKMRVIAYDPFLSEEKATELGIDKVDLDNLFSKSDFITLHTPLTNETRGIIDKKGIAKMKEGVRIINCARGGLVVESDLKEALDSGKVAGAALDVFEQEPATENPLFNHENVICTPHLGASTAEAQENVALQVAEQLSDYLLHGAVMNAINMPSVSAQDAPKLKPYMKLAEQMGSFVGQLTKSAITDMEIAYEGHVAALNTKPLSSLILAGFLRPLLDSVNVVSAPALAKERGINISEMHSDTTEDFHTLIRVTVKSETRTRMIEGTLFGGEHPRIVNVEGVPIEAELGKNMLFIRNKDVPGLIGAVGTTLGEAGHNISHFRNGRKASGEEAICLISVDEEISKNTIEKIEALPQVDRVKALQF